MKVNFILVFTQDTSKPVVVYNKCNLVLFGMTFI